MVDIVTTFRYSYRYGRQLL